MPDRNARYALRDDKTPTRDLRRDEFEAEVNAEWFTPQVDRKLLKAHIEHHSFPMVPWHRLPELHGAIKSKCAPAYLGVRGVGRGHRRAAPAGSRHELPGEPAAARTSRPEPLFRSCSNS